MATIEQRIVEMIRITRDRNHACTAREVARQLRLSPTAVVARLNVLRAEGLVQWNAVPGSLHLTNDVAPNAEQGAIVPASPVATAPEPLGAPEPPITSLPPDPVAAARAQIERGELTVPESLRDAVLGNDKPGNGEDGVVVPGLHELGDVGLGDLDPPVEALADPPKPKVDKLAAARAAKARKAAAKKAPVMGATRGSRRAEA